MLPVVAWRLSAVEPVARTMSRPVERVPTPRKPLALLRRIRLAASPRAPSLVAASQPLVTARSPVKVLPEFESRSVPSPVLVRPLEPEKRPEMVRPPGAFEAALGETKNRESGVAPARVSVPAPTFVNNGLPVAEIVPE